MKRHKLIRSKYEVWSHSFIVSKTIGVFFCPSQYPQAKNHSWLSLAGTGSEEEEQVMTT